MLEYYPMADESNMGFVIVDTDFEAWLIATLGLSFEDISYAVIGEDEDEMEIIVDEEDFGNLQDIYEEYMLYGWMILEDPDFEEWEETFQMNADMARKMYIRGYNPQRFARSRTSPRSTYAKTRRNIRKDMFGSVTLTGVVTTVGVIGLLAYLLKRS